MMQSTTPHVHDSKARSVVKSIIWRIIATLLTWIITYLFIGKLGQATEIALVGMAVGTIIYYIHERIWDWIDWGKEIHS